MSDFFNRLLSSRLVMASSVTLLLVLIGAAVFRIIPWWLFLLILVFSVVGVFLYAIISEWLALRRDKGFERGMGVQADAQMAKHKMRDRDAVRDMHDRWKEGFERLRQTRVGRGRKAVYFLPWYMIIGKPATGKTTAIRNSGLHFPLGVPKTAGTGGTRNCDWFFTEEAILLDTAGRYAQSDENQADKDEWLAFLKLVRKYRKDVPINGLLVAVAADDVVGKERDEIIADARSLRSKLDELIRELGVQFPVYLLLTKCDLIQGFTEFFGRLPKARLTELLGWTNPSFELDDVGRRIEEAFTALRDRARSLRPGFLNEETKPVALRNVYLFPEELDDLSKNLAVYCDTLFRETQYGESAFFRGIYLTSGLQTGSTVSRLLGRLGLSSQASGVSEGSRSFFLQDFFQERLKADQSLVAPTGRASIRFRIANNLALAGVIGICVLVGLLATASYVRNRTLLLSIQDSVEATNALPGKPPPEQVALLDRYRQAIETLRYRSQHRAWLERFGLYSGGAVERPVVDRFLNSYEAVAYRPALNGADAVLSKPGDATRSFAALDSLIAYLVLMKTAQAADLTTGGETLAPWWNPVAVQNQEARDQFAAGYRFYTREPWRSENRAELRAVATQDRAQQLALVKQYLPTLLSVDSIRRWLANGKPVRGTDFDLPPGAGTRSIVAPAFTPPAWRDRVVPLLAALEQISADLGGDVTGGFAQQYANAYFREWQQFVLDLQEPAGGYDSRRFCEEKSPYFTVFAAAHDATTTPFMTQASAGVNVPASTAASGTGAPGASPPPAPTTFLPGFEPPAWVKNLSQVVAGKPKYTEKMDPACKAGGGGASDACGAMLQLAGTSGASPGQLTQIRDWVNDDLVAVRAAVNPDDRRVRDQVARLLNVPVGGAAVGNKEKCAGQMRSQLCQALERFPERPPWTLEQLETMFVPGRGAIAQYCEQTLTPFFNCTSLQSKPGTPVPVPGDIVSFLGRSERFSRTFFDSGGGWRTQQVAFESVPTESRSQARVTQTTLSVSCSNTLEQPWKLSHRQTQERKTLAWRPDQCSDARIQVTLSPSGGAQADERTVEIQRQGPFGLLDLLNLASRSGNEYRWEFPNDQVIAAFRVVIPDQAILEAGNTRLYGCKR